MRTFTITICLACAATIILVGFGGQVAHASTAAFAGKVVDVHDCSPNDKECRRRFTVRIEYFDYISWGKFNSKSKTGETITRKVKSKGTVCMLNGRLTSSATFAAAIAPGQWGYFYEDTWLDLYTTPDFQWGEVVGHDASKKQFDLRVHSTHKQIHLETNPPRTVTVKYDGDTGFRIENESSSAAEALTTGHWVQIHEPRRQTVLVRTPDARCDPGEWLPHTEGRRGYANDLTAPAILRGYQTEDPAGVLDVGVRLRATRELKGEREDVTLDCRKVSFILDGKLAPVRIAVKPGRHAVLGHYRSEKKPHKVFVRSHGDALRGVVQQVADDGSFVMVRTQDAAQKPVEQRVPLAGDAEYQLDGRPSTRSAALEKGRDVVVHPQRGRTIIAFGSNPPADEGE